LKYSNLSILVMFTQKVKDILIVYFHKQKVYKHLR